MADNYEQETKSLVEVFEVGISFEEVIDKCQTKLALINNSEYSDFDPQLFESDPYNTPAYQICGCEIYLVKVEIKDIGDGKISSTVNDRKESYESIDKKDGEVDVLWNGEYWELQYV